MKFPKDPAIRTELLLTRDEENFINSCNKDVISGFEDFKFRPKIVGTDIKPIILLTNKDYMFFFSK